MYLKPQPFTGGHYNLTSYRKHHVIIIDVNETRQIPVGGPPTSISWISEVRASTKLSRWGPRFAKLTTYVYSFSSWQSHPWPFTFDLLTYIELCNAITSEVHRSTRPSHCKTLLHFYYTLWIMEHNWPCNINVWLCQFK